MLKLLDFPHLHADNDGLICSHRTVNHKNVLEFVVTGRRNGGTLVDFGRIEEIEDRKALHSEQAIHSVNAQVTLAIEEVGNVGLLKASLCSEPEASQLPLIDSPPQSFSQIFLQALEFHGRSIAWVL